MNLIVPITVGVAGFYKLEAGQLDEFGREIPGTKRVLADWFPNVLLNQGLDILMASGTLGWGGQLTAAQVGDNASDAANPVYTGLLGYIRGSSTRTVLQTGHITGSPYYGWGRFTYRFDPLGGGPANNKNYSEVGAGNTATPGNLVSRAAIVDGGGTPTSISVLYNEYLDVTYELRQYPPLVDVDIPVFNISGSGDHVVKIRAANCGTTSSWDTVHLGFNNVSNGNSCWAQTGPIGLITAEPSGAIDSSSVSNSAYVTGNYYRDVSATFSIAQGAVPFRCLVLYTYRGNYQAEFTPVIPKDNTKQLNIVWRVSIARRDPL